MADFKKTNNKAQNQFTARTVSRKTGAMISWIHPVDSLARAICGVKNVSEMTAAMALEHLPQFHENELVELIITDLTSEQEVISATDY